MKDNFEKLMVEISRHDYGSPVKEYPRFVAMKGIDDKLPPDSAINNGSVGIRKYWNSKNLRKRSNKGENKVDEQQNMIQENLL